MDSELSDGVVHVDDRKTWTDAVLASLKSSDHHVSDEEIFAILSARQEGAAAADLLAASGVSLPMYCVWKTKYRHLSLEELRAARRRERWRTRAFIGVLIAAVVIGTGGIVVALARAAHASITASPTTVAPDSQSGSQQHPTDATPPATASGSVNASSFARSARQASPSRPSVLNSAAARAETQADQVPAVTETGYRIQVAAAPTRDEGRAIVERLANIGYPAYLLRASVSNTEVFRVRIGPFETFDAAAQVAAQLKREGYDGAWIAQ